MPVCLALSGGLLLASGMSAVAGLWIEAFRGSAGLLPPLSQREARDVGSIAPFFALFVPVLMRAAVGAAVIACAAVLFGLTQSGFTAAPRALRPRWRRQGIAALTAAMSRERCIGMLLGLGAIAALVVEASLWSCRELLVWVSGLPFTPQVVAALADGKRLGWHIALTVLLAERWSSFNKSIVTPYVYA